MLNFTVGPVQESESVLRIGAQQTPYFRNQFFSEIMLENEKMMKQLARAQKNARVVFLTASGTGAMEAAVINSFSKEDKVLVVDGGGFGHRFVQLLELHEIPHTVVQVSVEDNLTEAHLAPYENQGFTGFLINMHETSIGKLYDMALVAEFCKRNQLFLVVDAISAFLADSIDMEHFGIDVLITGSQKALAVPPGISILVFSEAAVHRVNQANVKSMYFNLADALKNGERGQTPFTPAVSILLQIHERLKELCAKGVVAENARIEMLAQYFREKIATNNTFSEYFSIPNYALSNAVTPIRVKEPLSAYDIFETLEKDNEIWICPSGGALKDRLFRVGHIGCLTKTDIDCLVEALCGYMKKHLR